MYYYLAVVQIYANYVKLLIYFSDVACSRVTHNDFDGHPHPMFGLGSGKAKNRSANVQMWYAQRQLCFGNRVNSANEHPHQTNMKQASARLQYACLVRNIISDTSDTSDTSIVNSTKNHWRRQTCWLWKLHSWHPFQWARERCRHRHPRTQPIPSASAVTPCPALALALPQASVDASGNVRGTQRGRDSNGWEVAINDVINHQELPKFTAVPRVMGVNLEQTSTQNINSFICTHMCFCSYWSWCDKSRGGLLIFLGCSLHLLEFADVYLVMTCRCCSFDGSPGSPKTTRDLWNDGAQWSTALNGAS